MLFTEAQAKKMNPKGFAIAQDHYEHTSVLLDYVGLRQEVELALAHAEQVEKTLSVRRATREEVMAARDAATLTIHAIQNADSRRVAFVEVIRFHKQPLWVVA
jgi:hypothetical protein